MTCRAFCNFKLARVTGLGPGLLSAATADFNGDGISDILFQNSSGQVTKKTPAGDRGFRGSTVEQGRSIA
jgi:hypothetical protein